MSTCAEVGPQILLRRLEKSSELRPFDGSLHRILDLHRDTQTVHWVPVLRHDPTAPPTIVKLPTCPKRQRADCHFSILKCPSPQSHSLGGWDARPLCQRQHSCDDSTFCSPPLQILGCLIPNFFPFQAGAQPVLLRAFFHVRPPNIIKPLLHPASFYHHILHHVAVLARPRVTQNFFFASLALVQSTTLPPAAPHTHASPPTSSNAPS